MSQIIGRNDPCPCKSGAKFKKCCADGRWSYFIEQFGMQYYHEGYILSEVLKNERFNSFYSNERQKISKEVYFCHSDKMLAAASYGHIGEDLYVIASSECPVKPESSIHMAHEIEHLVLCSEGHKNVNYRNEVEARNGRRHKFINDMIYDPIVNRKLFSYGYDLLEYFEYADRVQMRTIGKKSTNPEDIFLTMTLYVKKTLDFRNLYPDIDAGEIKFNQWVKENYPQIVPQCEQLLKVSTETGNRNSADTEQTLMNVIECLELADQLIIRDI